MEKLKNMHIFQLIQATLLRCQMELIKFSFITVKIGVEIRK